MNEVKKAGLWTLAVGGALSLAMFLLMVISRMMDPNGVPILPVLVLMLSGLILFAGLVLTVIGMRSSKSNT